MVAFHSPARKNGTNPASSSGAPLAAATKNGGTAQSNGVKLGASTPVVQEGRLRKILKVIESEQHRHIQELAVECKLSQSHLQHLFKQHTGICLGHLLSQQRLGRAAHLLAYSNMSIKEIACAVGYEHTSSFTRAFVRRFETAPSRYRRMANAKC